MSRSKSTVPALITCEHASNAVPARWRSLFAGSEAVLAGHRGWDPGALDVARALAAALEAPLLAGSATRLLIDLNRSAGHPRRFSEWTRSLPRRERDLIEREWWLPHWRAFASCIESAPGRLVHIACHSFTPVLDGRERRFDLGLLYDPARSVERHFARELSRRLKERFPDLATRMNQPYLGTANGIGQQHRRRFGADRLLTLELEISQALVDRSDWPRLAGELARVVAEAISDDAGYGVSCASA
ncbi:MAG: N-formylglutamate amidohydrolase [Gammaproteobacteria bacterium]|jgi:predicted N-formylglutamate amidohydrolase|nr:N-formylglutamate amidohydrolase [Gammaproteobacteria bacterium]